MSKPSNEQVAAAATILAATWDSSGDKAFGEASAYSEWAFGIVDMINHGATIDAVAEYLGTLDQQLGVACGSVAERSSIARELIGSCRAAGP